MSDSVRELVLELLLLRERYSPAVMRRAVEWIGSRGESLELLELVSEIQKLGTRTQHVSTKRNRSDSIAPQEATLRSLLQSRLSGIPIAVLREMAPELGVRVPERASREKVVQLLAKKLRNKPEEEVNASLDRLVGPATDADSGFVALANEIMRRNPGSHSAT